MIVLSAEDYLLISLNHKRGQPTHRPFLETSSFIFNGMGYKTKHKSRNPELC